MEAVVAEIEPQGETLPRHWAGSSSVALALSRAESGVSSREGSDVDDELGPGVWGRLEDGPPWAAFPSGHHDGGHRLFFGCFDEDPANQTKRGVHPQI